MGRFLLPTRVPDNRRLRSSQNLDYPCGSIQNETGAGTTIQKTFGTFTGSK